jgi:thiol:disulfide interchange protein DsbD
LARRALTAGFGLLSGIVISVRIAAATPIPDEPVIAELASEVSSVAPGQPFWVALSLTVAEGWHVNWRNPGDAGLPPSMDWVLPAGFTAGEIQWPYPERIALPRLVDYGYHDSVLLPVMITPPEDLSIGSHVSLQARAEWLACSHVCVPGSAHLSLNLPVSQAAPQLDPRWAPRFLQTRTAIPVPPRGWRMAVRLNDAEIALDLVPPDMWKGDLNDVFFAPFASDLIEHAAPQSVTYSHGRLMLSLKRNRNGPDRVRRVAGILFNATGWDEDGDVKAINIDLPTHAPESDQDP